MNAQQVRAMINSVYTAALTQVVLDGNVGPEVGYQLKHTIPSPIERL